MLKKIFRFLRKKSNIVTLKKRVFWVAGYAVRYWKEMLFYTLLGLSGTALSLVSSLVSKDLVDIITGHQTGKLVTTFIFMICMTLGSTLVTQISGYFSSKINLRVENTIRNEIFEKILSADWEHLSRYHTGDLLTRWGNDVSSLSNAILSYIPNSIIYLFRFGAAFAIMAKHDVSFALIAMAGMPFTYFISRNLTRRMQKNNMRSSVMNAKMSGFNQEAFSNIQTIKAFDMIGHYVKRLRELQTDYVKMRLNYQKVYIVISLLLTLVGL
jgi:ABC-type multidrug transport system fused ATPase/permease subunit